MAVLYCLLANAWETLFRIRCLIFLCVCVCVCVRALEIESRPYDIIMAGKKVIYFLSKQYGVLKRFMFSHLVSSWRAHPTSLHECVTYHVSFWHQGVCCEASKKEKSKHWPRARQLRPKAPQSQWASCVADACQRQTGDRKHLLLLKWLHEPGWWQVFSLVSKCKIFAALPNSLHLSVTLNPGRARGWGQTENIQVTNESRLSCLGCGVTIRNQKIHIREVDQRATLY